MRERQGEAVGTTELLNNLFTCLQTGGSVKRRRETGFGE